MKHCGTQELETGRLLLRRLSIDDSEMMYNNWASDPQVAHFMRWDAHRSWVTTAELLNEWEKHYPEPDFYQWGIENKHSGVLFGRKWWNQGYATEALCAVRDYWFGTVGGLWLAACHANENIASSAVLQKAGFVYDHDATCRRFDGTPMPCRAYHLLKEDL